MWVLGDYGLPYSLGFGSVPGHAWGMARDRDGKEYISCKMYDSLLDPNFGVLTSSIYTEHGPLEVLLHR